MTSSATLYQVFCEQTGRAFFAYSLHEQEFTYRSPAFLADFSWDEATTATNSLLTLVHPEDQAYARECWDELMREGVCRQVELRIQRPGEEEQWVCLDTVLWQQEGREPCIMGHAQDITANRQYNNHLKRFSNKKDSVLNILSHDLAAMLGMIHNLSEVLAEELATFGMPQVQQTIKLIERTSRQGTEVLHEFMNQEFLESSQTQLVTRRVNLVDKIGEMMEEYLDDQKATLMRTRVEFVCNSEEIYAEVDDLKFLQVITNLISNALKFTPEGGLITVRVTDEEETVLVTVADTGIGIPQKYHATLFDKFTTARRPGLHGERSVGLGMSICKTIVEWHKGSIWFESEENKGTTFYIRLPKN